MGHHQCLHACQCPTNVNNPTYWLSSLSQTGDAVEIIHFLVTSSSALMCLDLFGPHQWHGLINLATPEFISLGQRNLRMEFGHASFAFSPPDVWIKGCDSCVQILAWLERISICVIFSLQELSSMVARLIFIFVIAYMHLYDLRHVMDQFNILHATINDTFLNIKFQGQIFTFWFFQGQNNQFSLIYDVAAVRNTLRAIEFQNDHRKAAEWLLTAAEWPQEGCGVTLLTTENSLQN